MATLPTIVVPALNSPRAPITPRSTFSRASSDSSASTASFASLPIVRGRTSNNTSNQSVVSLLGSEKTEIVVASGIAGLLISGSDDESESDYGSDESSVSSVDTVTPEKSSRTLKPRSSRAPKPDGTTKRPGAISPKGASGNPSSTPTHGGKSKTVAKLTKELSPIKPSAIARNHSAPDLVGSPDRFVKKHINDDLSHHNHHVLLSKPIAAVPHIHITVNAKDADEIASHATVVHAHHGPLPVVRKTPLAHPGAIQHQQALHSAAAVSPSAHRLLSSGVPDNLIDSVESLVNAQYYAGVPHFAQATVGALLGNHSPHGHGHHPH